MKVLFILIISVSVLAGCATSTGRYPSGVTSPGVQTYADSIMEWAKSVPGATRVYHTRDARCDADAYYFDCRTTERAGSSFRSGGF